MFWEMYQMSAISAAARNAQSAERTANAVERRTRPLEQDVRRLESRIDALALGCQSLWELLCEKTDLTQDDIVERMQEIDLRDGKLDGRLRATVGACPKCNRPVNSRRPNCIYCGEQMERVEQIFDR
jgi:phage-related minor tail protein